MKKVTLCASAIYGLFLAAWCIEAGNPLHYVFNDGPRGQAAYLLSKCIGFLAMAGLITQIGLGVSSKLKVLDADYRIHAFNGVILLGLVLSHPLLFSLGVSLRSEQVAWGVFIPKFSDYYHAMVGVGIVAAIGVITAFTAGYMFSRTNAFYLKIIHITASVVGALGLLHAFTIGSETRHASVLLVTFLIIGSLFLTIYMSNRQQTARA